MTYLPVSKLVVNLLNACLCLVIIIFQIGPSGYVFAVNNNGMIIFHPRLKTVVSI